MDRRLPRERTPTPSPRSPRSNSSCSSTGTSESLLGEGDPQQSRKRKRRDGVERTTGDYATSSRGRGSVTTEKRTTSKMRKKEADAPDKKRGKKLKRMKKKSCDRDRNDGKRRKRRGVGEGKVKKNSKRRREKTKPQLFSSSRAQTVAGGSKTGNNDAVGSISASGRTRARPPSPEDPRGAVNHRARSHPPAVETGTNRAASLSPPSEPVGSSQGPRAASSREARAKTMVPMRLEEYKAQQNIIREVFDEDTGRWRLVRGTGEIIERIVSRRKQHAIQQHASRWGWDHKALLGAAVSPSGSSFGGR